MAHSPACHLFGETPGRLSADAAARTVVTLSWRAGPLPGDPWLAQLLPLGDHNGRLLARFAGSFRDPLEHGEIGPALERERLAAVRAAGLVTVAAIWNGACWPAGPPADLVLAPRGARAPARRRGTLLYAPRPARSAPRDLLALAPMRDHGA